MKGTLLGIPFFAPPSAPLAKVCLSGKGSGKRQ